MKLIVHPKTEKGRSAVQQSVKDTNRTQRLLMRANRIQQEVVGGALVINLPKSFRILGLETWSSMARDVMKQNGASKRDYEIEVIK